jgi:hypothetical protein
MAQMDKLANMSLGGVVSDSSGGDAVSTGDRVVPRSVPGFRVPSAFCDAA